MSYTGARSHTVASALVLVGFCFLGGCANQIAPEPPDPTMLDELYELCFSGSVDCEECSISLLLYLDTMNLPGDSSMGERLILSSEPTTPISGADRLAVWVSPDLPPEIDPGLFFQLGWKTRVRHGSIEYHYGRAPPPDWISVAAVLDSVDFVFDPEDTMQIYIDVQQRTESP